RCRRPPPLPPLFPYTTLFRSVNDPAWDKVAPQLDPARPETAPILAGAEIAVDRSLGRRWVGRLLEAAAREGGRAAASLGPAASTDRKSTRLNSSHLGISYAVF